MHRLFGVRTSYQDIDNFMVSDNKPDRLRIKNSLCGIDQLVLYQWIREDRLN